MAVCEEVESMVIVRDVFVVEELELELELELEFCSIRFVEMNIGEL